MSTLNGVVEPCERAHGHYMRCMQLMRASEHQGSDEPLQKARAEGELGAAALSQAAGERWPPLVLERYQDRRDGFADLSRLPRSLDDVETVRGCVAIVAEKLGVVREVVAAHQHEVDGMAARLATLEAAFELETKRRSHLADALSEAAEAEAALGKAAAAIPAAVGKRYPEPSAPLFDVRPADTHRGTVALLWSIEPQCVALEKELRRDCETAQSRLKPIAKAIAAKERFEPRHQRAPPTIPALTLLATLTLALALPLSRSDARRGWRVPTRKPRAVPPRSTRRSWRCPRACRHATRAARSCAM